MLDIGRSFSYITADPDWIKKIVIGLLVGLIGTFVLGLGAIVLLGYQVAIIRAKLEGRQPELPEWNDWGGFIKDGIFAVIIALGYAAPIIILAICMQVVIFGVTFAGASAAPDATDLLGLVITLTTLCFGLIIVIYIIFLSLAMPIAITRYVAEGGLGAAFALGEVFALLRSNIVGWLIVGLLYNGIILPLLALVGTLLCGLGTYGGLTFGYAASADAMVQAYVGAGGRTSGGGSTSSYGGNLPPTSSGPTSGGSTGGGYDPNATMVDRPN